MAPPRNPGTVGVHYKQSCYRLCHRQNLHRQIEKCLCSGPELLFLPRCCRRLSYRFSSGCDRELEFQDGLLCGGISYLHWSYGGRLICGFLCPFGLIQDLLNEIPFPKKIRTFKGDKLLRKLKYVIFAVFVILLPLFLVDIMGQGAPYFCKLICPAGTLEGGLPLVLLNKSMRSALGWLYIWKNVILVITIILSILIYRPFCKYICPLGALYSVFNPVSLYKYRVDKDKCIKCGKCAKACQMIVDPVENSNSPECIRCGRCRKVCPTDAIQCGIRRK